MERNNFFVGNSVHHFIHCIESNCIISVRKEVHLWAFRLYDAAEIPYHAEIRWQDMHEDHSFNIKQFDIRAELSCQQKVVMVARVEAMKIFPVDRKRPVQIDTACAYRMKVIQPPGRLHVRTEHYVAFVPYLAH